MNYHVSGIFIVSGLWLVAIGILGYYLPRKVSRVFLLFTLIAHSFGASTWLSMKYGFWYALMFILFNAYILFYIVEDLVKKENTRRLRSVKISALKKIQGQINFSTDILLSRIAIFFVEN